MKWLLLVIVMVLVFTYPPVGVPMAVLGGAGWLLLRRSKGTVGVRPGAAAIEGGETRLRVVGTDHYPGLDKLNRGRVPVELRRDHGNADDANAVAVWAGKPMRMTGYIPSRVAAQLGPQMDQSGQSVIACTGEMGERGLSVLIPAAFSQAAVPAPVVNDPRLRPVVLAPWGRVSEQLEVEDEYLHRNEVAAVLVNHGAVLNQFGDEVDGIEGLLALSDSDPSTIFVVCDGLVVGRLSGTDASRYLEEVRKADDAQANIPVQVRLWARDDEGVIRSRASIRVAAPDAIRAPAHLPAEPHVVLPYGTRVQVTGEDRYLNELSAILAGRSEAPVVATLHEVQPVGRASKSKVEVRIDGQPVGALSPGMSEHFLPTIQACAEEGLTVACRAAVVGNSLKADVVLDSLRSGDLSHDWIADNVYGRRHTEGG